MSFYYTRVVKEPERPPTYGFRKAEADEIAGIVQRVARPTYSSVLSTEEPTAVHNFPYTSQEYGNSPRTPSACKRRQLVPGLQRAHDRKLTDWEIQRLLRRIQKPTETSLFKKVTTEQSPRSSHQIGRRTRSADDRRKMLERLVRPTTASRAKRATECHTCDEENRENTRTPNVPFRYKYADDRTVPTEAVGAIVKRLRSPTHSSDRTLCRRLSPREYTELPADLPLISGLAKSRNVHEIVNRLHKQRHHGYKIEATPLC